MTVETSFLCETCGGEFPVSEMDGGPDGRGTFCLDCGCEACGEAMDAAELAALMARMPSWEEFLVACGITTSERLVGNCHWAATVLRDLLRTRGVPCRLRRGFWHGDDRRESRAGCAFQQHSWVEARPGGIVFTVDPTQWVFTGAEPGIAIAEDDLRYDGEGRLVEEAAARAAGNYEAPDREGDLSPSKLSDEAREALTLLAERDWSVWTPAELYWAAHLHPDRMGQAAAGEIQTAIGKAGGAAMIPNEFRTDVIDSLGCGEAAVRAE
jgi:hypothetical protein